MKTKQKSSQTKNNSEPMDFVKTRSFDKFRLNIVLIYSNNHYYTLLEFQHKFELFKI